jgi:Fungal Zn(2)-Cys(6) binuclear cluster domain
MSQLAAVTDLVAASASISEKNATSPGSARTSSSAPAPVPKSRSCVVCRNRKVRCDKQSPCSNCRRANIACVFPLADRPPRWARHLDRLTNNAAVSNAPARQDAGPGVGKVMDRLHNLENLVKELRGQLERAHAAASTADVGSSGVNSAGSSTQNRDMEHQRDPSPATDARILSKQFGRLVLQDASRSRYVSSGFWSRVEDEVSRPALVPPSS